MHVSDRMAGSARGNGQFSGRCQVRERGHCGYGRAHGEEHKPAASEDHLGTRTTAPARSRDGGGTGSGRPAVDRDLMVAVETSPAQPAADPTVSKKLSMSSKDPASVARSARFSKRSSASRVCSPTRSPWYPVRTTTSWTKSAGFEVCTNGRSWLSVLDSCCAPREHCRRARHRRRGRWRRRRRSCFPRPRCSSGRPIHGRCPARES